MLARRATPPPVPMHPILQLVLVIVLMVLWLQMLALNLLSLMVLGWRLIVLSLSSMIQRIRARLSRGME